MEYTRELQFALAMADAADALSMQRYRATDLVVETKPDATPVTEADQAVERMIRERIGAEMAGDGIVGEEFGDAASANGRQWIVDPIDGTKNYMRGVPVWSTLIGFAVNGELVVGVVSAPAMGRRWWAARGTGAWTRDPNGANRQLRVSNVGDIADASFSFSDAHDWDRHSQTSGALQRIIDRTWRQRAYGDFLSHMLVAEGAVDVSCEPTLSAWDMAALIPIITEAGGTVSGYSGGDPLTQTSLVATNGRLHGDVLVLIRG